MNSITEFVICIFSLVALVIVVKFDSVSEAKAYFRTEQGKGALKGILLAMVFGLALSVGSVVFASEKGEWFSYGDVYLGLDETKKLSPMCEPSGPDDSLTSNLGLVANIYRSHDEKFHFNAKYTHHSCALNTDDKSYDAFGVELKYRLWGN